MAGIQVTGGGSGGSGPVAWALPELTSTPQVLAQSGGAASGFIEFDSVFDQGGTGIEWDIADPTKIVLAPGWYTAYATVFYDLAEPTDYDVASVRLAIQPAANDPDNDSNPQWNEINPGGWTRVAGPRSGPAIFDSYPLFYLKPTDSQPSGAHVLMGLYLDGVTDDVSITYVEGVVIRLADAQ